MGAIVNTDQAAAWNGYEGGHWAANQDRYDAVNSGYNGLLLDAAAIGARDRVLDVGCGNGQLTRLAARRARDGHVSGVDLSAPMLATARASSGDVPNVTYERGDAQVHAFERGAYDVAVSRFGIMFFADPFAAFANILGALRPGGRLALLSLRPIGGSDLGVAFAAIAPHLPPPPAAEPGAAGPESLSDPGRIDAVLTGAGFTGVRAEPAEAPQVWGRDAEDAAGFLEAWGPVRHAVGRAGGGAAARVHGALVQALRPYEGPDGVVLRGAAWLITATRP